MSEALKARDPRTERPLRLALALAVLLVLGALAAALRLDGADEDLYGYIGYAWSRGDLPYRDAYENKPPGVFLVWALVFQFAGGSALVGRGLGVVAACATAWLLGSMAMRFWGSRWGMLAGVLYLGAVAGPQFGYPFADTEIFGIFFSVAALALVWPHQGSLTALRVLSAGALYGTALMFKPVFAIEAAIGLALVLLTAPSWPRRLGLAVVLGCGAALPVLAWVVYAQQIGLLEEFVRVAFGSLGTRDPVGRIKAFYAAQEKLFQPAFILLAVLALTSAATAARNQQRLAAGLFGVWVVLVFTAIAIPGSFWGHQFKQLLPPLCLLAPGVLAAVAGAEAPPEAVRPARWATASAVFLALFCSLVSVSEESVMTAARRLRRDAEEEGPTRVASRTAVSRAASQPAPAAPAPELPSFPTPQAAVARFTRPDDRIWCFPGSNLYVESRRLSAIRHFSPNFLMRAAPQEEVLNALKAGRAPLVLLSRVEDKRVPVRFVKELRATVDRHFDRVAESGDWDIYRFRTTSQATR